MISKKPTPPDRRSSGLSQVLQVIEFHGSQEKLMRQVFTIRENESLKGAIDKPSNEAELLFKGKNKKVKITDKDELTQIQTFLSLIRSGHLSSRWDRDEDGNYLIIELSEDST